MKDGRVYIICSGDQLLVERMWQVIIVLMMTFTTQETGWNQCRENFLNGTSSCRCDLIKYEVIWAIFG